jgi:hypothetical protein
VVEALEPGIELGFDFAFLALLTEAPPPAPVEKLIVPEYGSGPSSDSSPSPANSSSPATPSSLGENGPV